MLNVRHLEPITSGIFIKGS